MCGGTRRVPARHLPPPAAEARRPHRLPKSALLRALGSRARPLPACAARCPTPGTAALPHLVRRRAWPDADGLRRRAVLRCAAPPPPRLHIRSPRGSRHAVRVRRRGAGLLLVAAPPISPPRARCRARRVVALVRPSLRLGHRSASCTWAQAVPLLLHSDVRLLVVVVVGDAALQEVPLSVALPLSRLRSSCVSLPSFLPSLHALVLGLQRRCLCALQGSSCRTPVRAAACISCGRQFERSEGVRAGGFGGAAGQPSHRRLTAALLRHRSSAAPSCEPLLLTLSELHARAASCVAFGRALRGVHAAAWCAADGQTSREGGRARAAEGAEGQQAAVRHVQGCA